MRALLRSGISSTDDWDRGSAEEVESSHTSITSRAGAGGRTALLDTPNTSGAIRGAEEEAAEEEEEEALGKGGGEGLIRFALAPKKSEEERGLGEDSSSTAVTGRLRGDSEVEEFAEAEAEEEEAEAAADEAVDSVRFI